VISSIGNKSLFALSANEDNLDITCCNEHSRSCC